MGIGTLGFSEMVVIFLIVLVLFGPRRFPEIARSMGHAMREFRRSLNQIQRELEEADPRSALRDAGRPAAAPPTGRPASPPPEPAFPPGGEDSAPRDPEQIPMFGEAAEPPVQPGPTDPDTATG